MPTPLDTGHGTDAKFTTADFALAVGQGNLGAMPPPASAASPASPTIAVSGDCSQQAVDDAEGWNTKAKGGKENACDLTPNQVAPAGNADANEADQKRFLLTAANWTPGDYVALKPADLSELFSVHRHRCQAINAPLGRFLYHGYAGAFAAIGVTLNVLSWTTAKLSVLLADPKNVGRAPGSLTETITLHVQRARNMNFVASKVLYSSYAALTTPITVALNTVSWLAAQSAVVGNDPRRLGRVVLGLLFASIVLAGVAMVAGG